MTRDEARKVLEDSDNNIFYSNFAWFGTYMSCDGGCCSDSYNSIEEALDAIDWYSDGNWEEVYTR